MSNELSTYVTKEIGLKTILEDFKMKKRAFSSEKNSEHLKFTFLRNLTVQIKRDVANVMRQRKDIHAHKVRFQLKSAEIVIQMNRNP